MIPLGRERNTNREPEFTTLHQVAALIGRTTEFLKSTHITAGLPSVVNKMSHRVYRWSEIKKRLKANRLTPPDENHPLHKYTIHDASDIVGVDDRRLYRWAESGKLVIHQRSESGESHSFIYRKDLEWFIRNFDRRWLIRHMTKPLRMTETRTIMDLVDDTMRVLAHRNLIKALPRERRGLPRLFPPDALMHYITNGLGARALFRKHPMPELMTLSVARVYLGLGEAAMQHLRDDKVIVPEKVEVRPGVFKYMYRKDTLDRIMLEREMTRCYCDGLDYYTRPAIEYKFGKTNRWIDEYIVPNCRRIDGNHMIRPPKPEDGGRYVIYGWHRGDVEAMVATAGDEHVTAYENSAQRERESLRKKQLRDLNRTREAREKAREREKAKREREEAKERAREEKRRAREKAKALAAAKPKRKRGGQKKMPAQTTFYSDLDRIERAIDAAFNARAEARRETALETRKKVAEERARRDAIHGALELVTDYPENGRGRPNYWTRLKFSERREIFTILYNRNGKQKGGSMRYKEYPHEGDEYIILMTDRKKVKRRYVETGTSMPYLVKRGIEAIAKRDMKYTPAWIIVASSTSYVTEQRFYDILRMVPDQYGAVAPYGYEYLMPDGTHDSCPKTYGMYSTYSYRDPKTTFVIGSVVGETHEVAVMDGPFLAFRGEYMDIIAAELNRFDGLSESRAMMGPIVSAICRKKLIRMGVVSVNSVQCRDFDLAPGSLQWNATIGRIREYAESR